MHKGKTTARRIRTSTQAHSHTATTSRPITRKQSASLMLQANKNSENDEKFVLVEFIRTKALHIIEYNGLTKLNEQSNIIVGSHVLVQMNGEVSTSASVFCIGPRQQCLDELNIVSDQRGQQKSSNVQKVLDSRSSIATTPLESAQTRSSQSMHKTSLREIDSQICIDSPAVQSKASSESSIRFEPLQADSPQSNKTPNNTSSTESIVPIATTTITSLTAPSESTNRNVADQTLNPKNIRFDPLSDLTARLTEITKECNKWKSKYTTLEKRYNELQKVTMLIPSDDAVCDWICTIYDAIQRQVDADIGYDEESKKLGISSALLKYCVNQSKPPTTTARKLFQYVCQDELVEGRNWLHIPISKIDAIHDFGEKLFGYIKWDRKIIKISLQNFIRGERANLKRVANQNDWEAQNLDHIDAFTNEMMQEHNE